jgi:hypothetical protein
MLAAPETDRPKLPGPTLYDKFRSEILFTDPEASPRASPKGLSGRGLRAHISSMDDRAHEQNKPPPAAPAQTVRAPVAQPREIGGPEGPEPTRYGDWEYNGRCTDF